MEQGSSESIWTQTARFVARLQRLHDDNHRAELALLRRSLMRSGNDFAPYTVIGNVIPPGATGWRVDMYLLIAGLFALHATSTDGQWSMGKSLHTLRSSLHFGQESLDKQVAALLNADVEDLPTRLRYLMQRLKSDDIPVDYTTLLRDLLLWNDEKRRTQRNWARDYWEYTPASEGDAIESTGES